MDDHTLSLRLYELLDWIGASEEMRDKYRDNSIADEIISSTISNLCCDKPMAPYVFGSVCEGTTTKGLNSDVDLLLCLHTPVVEKLSDASQHGLSFLMVADNTTKPGYCKLQAVLNKVPIYHPDTTTACLNAPDQYGRVCVRHFHATGDDYQTINGPAATSSGAIGRADIDLVAAFRCHHIPSFATSWVTRVTSCDRLNETGMKMLTEFGCFFVAKNHPSSKNGPIEWRLSFSLQERELVYSLNPTQHKCYILLKMIKKDIINRRVPESISSYHCKTCVLYASERMPCDFWTRRNLLECMLICIKLLLYWVKEQYCPNYFIPEENMFDRLQHRTLRQIQPVLEDLVEHWCKFLWSITCDDICNVMSNVLFGCGPRIMRIKQNYVPKKTLELYLNLITSIRKETLTTLNQCNSISANNSILELHQMQTLILLMDCVRDHTIKETKQAIGYFIPHLRLQIAQCIASIMLTTIDISRLRMLFGLFKYYIEESKNCDTISSYLILASYCVQSDRNDICETILHQCETSLKSHVLSVCCCYASDRIYQKEEFNKLLKMIGSQDIPYTEFVRTCTSGCLVFLPHQANIVHPALHYEMYRSAYTPPDSMDGTRDYWFDWIVVDSKVYLYFIQYVLYSKTNKPVCKQNAVDNLVNVIKTDPHLKHKETAFNLLGWIFKQENKIQRAMQCFITSWRIRPILNAAKWHVLELSRSVNHFNSDRHML